MAVVTIFVARERAARVPWRFVARTAILSLRPTSAALIAYLVRFARGIARQDFPARLQRCHV